MKKYFGFIGIFILSTFLILYTFYVNSTIKNNDELLTNSKVSDFNISKINDTKQKEYYDNIISMHYKNKGVALEVKLSKVEGFYPSGRLLKVDVLKNFSKEKISKQIFINEPVEYHSNVNKFIVPVEGYIPIKENKQYLVILDKNKYDNTKWINNYEIYNLYGKKKSILSKFLLSDSEDDVYTDSHDVKKLFNYYKNEIFNIYGLK